MSDHVFITGCAKTGTTLLMRLFFAFEGVTVIPQEIGFNTFLREVEGKSMTAGKRGARDIFSNVMTPEEEEEKAEAVLSSGVRIVNCIRDGRDCLAGSGYGATVTPFRWIASMQQAERWPHLIASTVKYRRLCEDPDAVQADLSVDLNLTPLAPFSDYPSFVPREVFEVPSVQGLDRYGPRPIDESSIGRAGENGRPEMDPDVMEEFDSLMWRYIYND